MVAATLGAERSGRHRFYFRMSALFILIAFGGFIPTYWARIAAGGFHAAPIVHIHGFLFFLWTWFYFAQNGFVLIGRTPLHRAWGLAGISLATAMTISVVLATIHSMTFAETVGLGDRARAFAIVPLIALLPFVGFLSAGIANIRRTETHKRLMLMAMMPLMHAAIFRLYEVYLAPPREAGPPPPVDAVPAGLITDALIAVAMIHDWRRFGRVHRVYLIGAAIMLTEELTCGAFGTSQAWLAIAGWVESLAG